jgi:hypothetical protein
MPSISCIKEESINEAEKLVIETVRVRRRILAVRLELTAYGLKA